MRDVELGAWKLLGRGLYLAVVRLTAEKQRHQRLSAIADLAFEEQNLEAWTQHLTLKPVGFRSLGLRVQDLQGAGFRV